MPRFCRRRGPPGGVPVVVRMREIPFRRGQWRRAVGALASTAHGDGIEPALQRVTATQPARRIGRKAQSVGRGLSVKRLRRHFYAVPPLWGKPSKDALWTPASARPPQPAWFGYRPVPAGARSLVMAVSWFLAKTLAVVHRSIGSSAFSVYPSKYTGFAPNDVHVAKVPINEILASTGD